MLNPDCRHLTHNTNFIKFIIEIIMLHVHGENARVYIGSGKLLWGNSCPDEVPALI